MSPGSSLLQRLGQNHGGYRGQVIDIDTVLRDVERVARECGWLPRPMEMAPGEFLPAFHRPVASPRRQIYLSTGIHGDEPAGPLAVRQLVEENRWPDDFAMWLCPCLNPEGFRRNTREDAAGVDLNRDYLHRRAASVRAHIAWLQTVPAIDLSLCLHEDWEAHGFYVYELNPDQQPSLSEAVIERVATVCPIDLSPVIEGRDAQGGIIRPHLNPVTRVDWPESLYLLQYKTRLGYTLEAPSDFPLPARVDALVQGVRAALEALAGQGS